MEPTLRGGVRSEESGRGGDWVLVSRAAYWLSAPERWDVVIFESESSPSVPSQSVKRVVGLPGERIEVHQGGLQVDGRSLEFPAAVSQARLATLWPRLPLTLGEDELFVLGDNGYLSNDSRQNGPVSISALCGRVVCIVLPWTRRCWLR